jgi:hypothetical protein
VNLSGGLIRIGDDNKGVDFEVGELAVDVDRVQPGDEVDEDVVNALGDVLEERGSNLLVGRILGEVDRDKELLSLLVNVTDIDTTLVGEEDPVTLPGDRQSSFMSSLLLIIMSPI